MEDKFFYLHLKCENCGHTWSEKIPVGTLVKPDGNGALLYEENGEKVIIFCPNCQTFENIKKR